MAAPRGPARRYTLALSLAHLAACSSPELNGSAFTCETNADCLAGRICGGGGSARVCMSASEAPIEIGMTGPFRGPSRDLGIEMRRGILAQFEHVNQQGGVFGRRLQLTSVNDDYDPERALASVRELLDIDELAEGDSPDVRGPSSVFALLGNIGTPTTLATAPVANRNGVVMFSPFTGAHRYLRDGTLAPCIYNFRAGYFEETELIVDYMARHRQPRIISDPPADSYSRLLVFAQNDSYGDAGYAGVVEAYNRLAPLPQPDPSLPDPSIARITYERDDIESVEPAIAQAQEFLLGVLGDGTDSRSVGIVMIDTYQPGNKFIRAIKDWLNGDAVRAARLDVLFSHVSFVGSDSLGLLLTNPPEDYLDVRDPAGQRQRSYAEGVLITQVVPAYTSEAPGVSAYRADIDKFDGGPYSFTSLEGYLAAGLFVHALEVNGPDLTSENLRRTLDTQLTDIDLGIGAALGFSPHSHQASHTVWGSILQADGSAVVPFTWSRERGIRPN